MYRYSIWCDLHIRLVKYFSWVRGGRRRPADDGTIDAVRAPGDILAYVRVLLSRPQYT